MAITQAPFLSLGAKGQVAKTLVASTWKGIKTMRHYVKPANPRSTGQVAQRTLFADIVAFWKIVAMTEATVTAWNKLALVSGKPQSGFNSFSSAQTKLGKLTKASTVFIGPSSVVAGSIAMTISKITVAGKDSTATNKLYVGATPEKLFERTAVFTVIDSDAAIVYTPASGDLFFKTVQDVSPENESYATSGIYGIPAVTP